tara:strand:+ start:7802 stop:8401 length:600 start_codon:yes stop_codon:yes gene_type:complete
LKRQINDPYVRRAHKEGYRSRAAYKLQQIHEKFNLLKPGKNIVDLGAAPGGWTQVATEKVLPDQTGCQVISLDISEMSPIPGAVILKGDLFDQETLEELIQKSQNKIDVVLCDMAAPSTGHSQTDHLRTMVLAEVALEVSLEVLSEGGAFVVKVLQGSDEPELFKKMNKYFSKVKRFKPGASRSDSTELYIIGQKYKKN